MKKHLIDIAYLFSIALCTAPYVLHAQKDSTAKPERQSLIYLQYHVENNHVPFLYVQTKNKLENAFLVAPNVAITLYLNKDGVQDALIGKVVTNEKGIGSIGIPANLATNWQEGTSHTFFAHADSSANFGPAEKSVSATIARLVIDTTNESGTRSVVATLQKKEGGAWEAIPEVDVKIGVKRLGGMLSVGDKDAYTTDSSGRAVAEFAQPNLPGDTSGKLKLIAFVDDNDEVGTMETSFVVPWGVATVYKSDFGKRSLWATPTRAPIWLMFMAYGCIIAVWSVIIYLVTRIWAIRKLGTS